MRTRGFWLLAITAGVAVVLFSARSNALRAQTPQGSVALTGQVTSAEEGPMEGVLVSAKKTGSTITITVVSDEQGRYRFPAAKLDPGQYALRVRAVGYDLDGPAAVEVAPQKTATADIKLRKAQDLASQLSNTEWLAPAWADQRKRLSACSHCHAFERVARSRHSAEEFIRSSHGASYLLSFR